MAVSYTKFDALVPFLTQEQGQVTFAIGDASGEVATDLSRLLHASFQAYPGSGAYTTALEIPTIKEAFTATATGTSQGILIGTGTSVTVQRVATAAAATYFYTFIGVS